MTNRAEKECLVSSDVLMVTLNDMAHTHDAILLRVVCCDKCQVVENSLIVLLWQILCGLLIQ